MNGRALYIEIDEYCRAWLRNLIAADLICPGDVVGDILAAQEAIGDVT